MHSLTIRDILDGFVRPIEQIFSLIPDPFRNEKIISDVPFRPKKQSEDPVWPGDSWLFNVKSSRSPQEERQRWMDRHYGGGTHPIDL